MQYPIENYLGNQRNYPVLFRRPGFSPAASVVQQNVTNSQFWVLGEKVSPKSTLSRVALLFHFCPFVPDNSAYRDSNQECGSKEVARLPFHCLGRDVKESGQQHPDWYLGPLLW